MARRRPGTGAGVRELAGVALFFVGLWAIGVVLNHALGWLPF